MKLWLVERKDPVGYDQYDAVVVAAETAEEALWTHPSGAVKAIFEGGRYKWVRNVSEDHHLYKQRYHNSNWTQIEYLTVQYLGTTDRDIKGVILASYNAG